MKIDQSKQRLADGAWRYLAEVDFCGYVHVDEEGDIVIEIPFKGTLPDRLIKREKA